MSFVVTIDLVLPILLLTLYITGTAALFTWKIGQRWRQNKEQQIWLIFLLFALLTLADELWSIGVQVIYLLNLTGFQNLILTTRLGERIFTTICLIYIYHNGRKIKGGQNGS